MDKFHNQADNTSVPLYTMVQNCEACHQMFYIGFALYIDSEKPSTCLKLSTVELGHPMPCLSNLRQDQR